MSRGLSRQASIRKRHGCTVKALIPPARGTCARKFNEAVRTLTTPDRTAPYTIVVRALKLDDLAVQNEELHVTVNGAVEIR